MKKMPPYLAVVSMSVLLALFGCATTNKLSQPSTMTLAPTPDRALVYFIRPVLVGYAISAAVYDGEEFIGFIPYNQKLPYLAAPGKHRFMVVSEAADFMDADLQPNKTYYVRVAPRMGAWRARFSLLPVKKNELDTEKFKKSIENAQLIENKPVAYEWAEKNKASVLQKKEAYLKKWLEKDEDKQPRLDPEDAL